MKKFIIPEIEALELTESIMDDLTLSGDQNYSGSEQDHPDDTPPAEWNDANW